RSLIRLRHGARLARETQLPVLISGGRPLNADNAEAAVMADILKNEFGVAVRWREEQSQDTAGNARQSAEILRSAGIGRIVLVTQAFHMPRARMLFEAAGLQVVPAPAHFVSKTGGGFATGDLLPSASALHHSFYALHEWLGIAWARLSGV
ncbi:MAG: YdcF family protein, partial [Azonexus sp.]|nr:YdcF family protein [Azonexus sp.]